MQYSLELLKVREGNVKNKGFAGREVEYFEPFCFGGEILRDYLRMTALAVACNFENDC